MKKKNIAMIMTMAMITSGVTATYGGRVCIR